MLSRKTSFPNRQRISPTWNVKQSRLGIQEWTYLLRNRSSHKNVWFQFARKKGLSDFLNDKQILNRTWKYWQGSFTKFLGVLIDRIITSKVPKFICEHIHNIYNWIDEYYQKMQFNTQVSFLRCFKYEIAKKKRKQERKFSIVPQLHVESHRVSRSMYHVEVVITVATLMLCGLFKLKMVHFDID